MFVRFLNDQKGSTAIEYGLIASLIVVVIVGGIVAVGNSTANIYQNVAAPF
jgi:pilus assembly protein Flp/PilA